MFRHHPVSGQRLDICHQGVSVWRRLISDICLSSVRQSLKWQTWMMIGYKHFHKVTLYDTFCIKRPADQ